MNRVFWSVNFSKVHKDRTTETKTFYKLKDAKCFACNETIKGYILRLDDDSTKLVDYFGGFEPSAQEILRIESLTNFNGGV